MVDGTFVKELALETRRPQLVALNPSADATEPPDNILVVPDGWKELRPTQDEPNSLAVSTLTGLSSYLEANVDKLRTDALLLRVQDPVTVILHGALAGQDERFARHNYVAAFAQASKFPFGNFLDPETFIINVLTSFEPSPERDALLELVASIRETSSAEMKDDGVSQEVKTARSVAFVERQKLPNPLHLAPWRTFREVAQPVSQFVVRARPSSAAAPVTLALFAADGDLWKLKAIEDIRDWLARNTKSVAIVA